MALVHLIIALALAEFLVFGFAAGRARAKFKVAAPATTGNEMFERYYRVQMNTLELLMVFVPAMWMFAYYVSAPVAAALGALFIVGRVVYFFSYVRDPRKRGPGYGLSALPTMVLLIGAICGAVLSALRHP
jgi:glutathione S-transferase